MTIVCCPKCDEQVMMPVSASPQATVRCPLCCEPNGNTNGSEDEKITLSDITRSIDNVYISKGPTEWCR